MEEINREPEHLKGFQQLKSVDLNNNSLTQIQDFV